MDPDILPLGKHAIATFEKALTAVIPDKDLRWAFRKTAIHYY
jgi:hypothetical protein